MNHIIKYGLAITSLLVSSYATTSYADDKLYVNLSLFLAEADQIEQQIGNQSDGDDLDVGYGFSTAIGYKFEQGVRVEGEIAYRTHTIDDNNSSGDFDSTAFMANAYYDLMPSNSRISPYIGAGIGGAYGNDYDLIFQNGSRESIDSEFSMAYQLMAGASFQAHRNIELVLGYRYFAVPEGSFDSLRDGREFETEYDSHNLELGFRFSF